MKNFLSWFRKSAIPTTQVRFSEARDPRLLVRSYEGFSHEGYQKNVIAFRCISDIADACASIPYLLFRVSKTGKRTEVREHEVLRLLRRPNARQTATAFERELWSYFLISGNGYELAAGPKNVPPTELWTLQPNLVRVIPGQRGMPVGYEYRPNGQLINYPVTYDGKSSVHHMKTFNPTTIWEGMSPIAAAALGIDQLNAGALWNLSLMQNSAKPSLVITSEQSLTPDQFKVLKKDVRENHEGPWKSGSPMVLRQAKVQQISWTPMEMDWLNSKKTSEKDVGLAFGVPSQMLGIEDSMKFDNMELAVQGFYLKTVIPLKRRRAEELTHWLLPAFGDASLELGIDEEAIDALEPMREKKWKRSQESETLTLNEKRELQGYGRYEPSEEPGDKILVSAGMVPLEVAAEGIDERPTEDNEDVGGTAPESDDTDPIDEEADDAEAAGEEEEKSFNLRSASARQRYLIQQARKKVTLARSLGVKLISVFSHERDRIAKGLEGVESESIAELVIDRELAKSRDEFALVLRAELLQVGKTFGAEVLEQAKSLAPGFETKGSRERFDFSLSHFLEARIKTALVRIPRTTKKRLMRQIKEALGKRGADGHRIEISFPAVVKDSYSRWSASRAAGTSRTEVHIAAEESKRQAADALQLPSLQKEWVASHDDRTRDAHVELDGQAIDLKDKFEVDYKSGVELMDGPGDKDGSAENVINCRCTLVFISK